MIIRHALCFFVSSDCYIVFFVVWCACGGRGGFVYLRPTACQFYDFFHSLFLIILRVAESEGIRSDSDS